MDLEEACHLAGRLVQIRFLKCTIEQYKYIYIYELDSSIFAAWASTKKLKKVKVSVNNKRLSKEFVRVAQTVKQGHMINNDSRHLYRDFR